VKAGPEGRRRDVHLVKCFPAWLLQAAAKGVKIAGVSRLLVVKSGKQTGRQTAYLLTRFLKPVGSVLVAQTRRKKEERRQIAAAVSLVR
jgi:hypothetical protein